MVVYVQLKDVMSCCPHVSVTLETESGFFLKKSSGIKMIQCVARGHDALWGVLDTSVFIWSSHKCENFENSCLCYFEEPRVVEINPEPPITACLIILLGFWHVRAQQ